MSTDKNLQGWYSDVAHTGIRSEVRVTKINPNLIAYEGTTPEGILLKGEARQWLSKGRRRVYRDCSAVIVLDE